MHYAHYISDVQNSRYQLYTQAKLSSGRQKFVTCPWKRFWPRYDLGIIYIRKKVMRNGAKYCYILHFE